MRCALAVPSICFFFLTLSVLAQQGRDRVPVPGPVAAFSQLLGRPRGDGIVVSVQSDVACEARVRWSLLDGSDERVGETVRIVAGEPREIELRELRPDRGYRYRVETRGKADFVGGEWHEFHTARSQGTSFVFGVQGDSHPERPTKMYDPALYARTMQNVAAERPDFYFCMGDDFSIERFIERGKPTQSQVDGVYAHQRGFLGIVGCTSPVFLVNGNHEQAARYLLDGTDTNPAVLAGRSRIKHFPLPVPDGFYTGNTEPVEHVGLPRDYYAWSWGDALFVVIDPYWHSPVAVDNQAGEKAPARGENTRERGEEGSKGGRGGKGNRDLWAITLGDRQYRWLEKTLRESHATFKFVFSHHVMGTGRGGVEVAGRYEWGGDDQRGIDRFREKRPNWDLPIHDLMRETGVTVFFQGHDHLYARQELDGVIYQTVPNPADPTFTAFNKESYRSGIIHPNSGHLRVTVAPDEVKVEYVGSRREQDEAEHGKNRTIVHSYTIPARRPERGKP